MQHRDTVARGALLVAAALGLGLVPVASQAQGAKTTIVFANWAAAESSTRPGLEAAIAAFEKAHPDITIKSEAISFSEIAHQLVLRVKSGNPPDVAEIAGNDTFLLATTGKVEPLDGYLGDLKSTLKPASYAGLKYKDKLIALPWTEAPAGLWYNKAIMQKAGLNPDNPPRTMKELMDALTAIKASQPDVIPLGMDTTNRTFALDSNWPWMQSFGANPVANAASPEMKNYLSWMRDLAKGGYIDPGRKIGEFRPLAAQDKVAFTWDQVLLQGVIQSAGKIEPADFYKKWGVTTLPTGNAGKSFTFEGGHQVVMFSASKQKKAAWTFMQWLTAAPDSIKGYTIKYESSLPSVGAGGDAELAKMLDTPVFTAFSEKIIPTLTTPPYGPDYPAAATAIMAGVQEAVTGSAPIDQVANSIQQRLQKK